MLTKNEKLVKLKNWLKTTKLDAEVVGRTLGINESSINANVLLQASAKLIKVNKREVDPDDRDNLRFSRFLGMEDYVAEHINKDAGQLQRKATQKMKQKRNLSWMSAGFFTPQVRSVVIGNALSQNVDGINPIEHWDNSHRVTKLGPGGIPSIEAVPDESRQVNTSSFGFFDPVHIMESDKVGVINYLAHNVVKGRDNKLYRIMEDSKGKKHWTDHETVLNRQAVIPEH